jgi:hypothetical protein
VPSYMAGPVGVGRKTGIAFLCFLLIATILLLMGRARSSSDAVRQLVPSSDAPATSIPSSAGGWTINVASNASNAEMNDLYQYWMESR